MMLMFVMLRLEVSLLQVDVKIFAIVFYNFNEYSMVVLVRIGLVVLVSVWV